MNDDAHMTRAELMARAKQAEEQLKLLSKALESAANGIAITDAQGRILWVNPAFTRLTGYDRAEVVGKNPRILKSGKHPPEFYRQLWETILRGKPWHGEMSNRRKDGSLYPEEMTITPVRTRGGKITHFVAVKQDITDRKRLEKEILEISDREHRRIGQDLHDGLCQQLAAIELMSQALEQKIAGRSRADAARAGAIAGHVREAIRQTRLLARGLSPVTLESSEGLMSALQELAANTEKLFQVRCRFECGPPVLVWDYAMATHLFRIAQEAVSNALKHGKATQISIRLTQPRGGIRLVVSDNGAGFRELAPKQKGMGLRIMASRAGMIGGTLVTENNPAGGARVTCAIPGAGTKQKNNDRGGKKEKPEIQEADSHR